MIKIKDVSPYSVDIKEAAKFTGLKVRHLRLLTYKGTLPVHRIGRNLIFTLHDLKVFVDFHRVDVPQ